MQKLGHEHRTLDALVLDVEGGEWEILADFERKGLWPRLDQLVVDVQLDPLFCLAPSCQQLHGKFELAELSLSAAAANLGLAPGTCVNKHANSRIAC